MEQEARKQLKAYTIIAVRQKLQLLLLCLFNFWLYRDLWFLLLEVNFYLRAKEKQIQRI